VRANALLLLLARTLTMMHGYKNRLAEEFAAQGGFKERMSEVRSEARAKVQTGTDGGVPKCPVCGGAMRLRKTKANNKPFWGCCDYPLCKGIVECRRRS
jgi:four helix bundle suffix protein